MTGLDAWGSSNVWGAPEPAPTAASSTIKSDPLDSGWHSTAKSTKPSETTIAADEDFGGWNSAPAFETTTTTTNKKSTPSTTKPSGGFGGNDDLFGNVWG
jgi:stromal membrane-associated protein